MGACTTLYDRLELARGMPTEEAIRICKEIVNDSIMDDKAAMEAVTGVRSETFDVHHDALRNAVDAAPESQLYYGRPGRESDAARRSHLRPGH